MKAEINPDLRRCIARKWWDPETLESAKTTYLGYMKSQACTSGVEAR